MNKEVPVHGRLLSRVSRPLAPFVRGLARLGWRPRVAHRLGLDRLTAAVSAAGSSSPGGAERARRPDTPLGGLAAREGAKVGRIGERSAIWALAIIVMACALVVVRHGSGVSSGADGSGYYNLARLLARGRSTWEFRPVAGVTMGAYNPSIFTPLGFSAGKRPGELVPVYEPGLPLHLALAAPFVGWDNACVLVNVLAGIATLLLIYYLARRLGLPPWWGVAAVVLFALLPLSPMFYTGLFSEALATAWCAAVIALALASRRSAVLAAVAGFGFGIAVTVRPTDALLVLAIAVALDWRRRTLLSFVAGGLPVAIAFMGYNLHTYGHPIATGYWNMPAEFRLSYFWARLEHFALWLSRFWTPLALLLFLGVLYFAIRRERRHLLVTAWFLPFVAFYSFYSHSDHAWWYLRFLLPGIPGLLLGALMAAFDMKQAAVRRWGSRRAVRPLLAGVLLGAAAWAGAASLHWVRFFDVIHLMRGDVEYGRDVAWMQRMIPVNTAVVCMQVSGAVYTYSHFPVIRVDILDPASAKRLAHEVAGHRTPVFALLFEFELPRFQQRYGSAFREVGRRGRATLWKLND
jgi:hypothetical protein